MKYKVLALTALAACVFAVLPAMAQSVDTGEGKASVRESYSYADMLWETARARAEAGGNGSVATAARLKEDEESFLAKEQEDAEKTYLAGNQVFE